MPAGTWTTAVTSPASSPVLRSVTATWVLLPSRRPSGLTETVDVAKFAAVFCTTSVPRVSMALSAASATRIVSVNVPFTAWPGGACSRSGTATSSPGASVARVWHAASARLVHAFHAESFSVTRVGRPTDSATSVPDVRPTFETVTVVWMLAPWPGLCANDAR